MTKHNKDHHANCRWRRHSAFTITLLPPCRLLVDFHRPVAPLLPQTVKGRLLNAALPVDEHRGGKRPFLRYLRASPDPQRPLVGGGALLRRADKIVLEIVEPRQSPQ